MTKTPGTKKGVPKKALPEAIPRPSSNLTPDEQRAIIDKVCTDYETGQFTIISCCANHGISHRTFLNWVQADPINSTRFKDAKAKSGTQGREWLKEKCIDGLQRLITGFWIEEPESETTTFKNAKGKITQTITRVKTKKKYFAPVPAAIIFTLKNMDPENWNRTEPTGDPNEPEQVWKIGDQIITF